MSYTTVWYFVATELSTYKIWLLLFYFLLFTSQRKWDTTLNTSVCIKGFKRYNTLMVKSQQYLCIAGNTSGRWFSMNYKLLEMYSYNWI